MGTLDQELHARDVSGWNSQQAHKSSYTPQELKDETDDMLEILLRDSKQVTDAMFDEGFDYHDIKTLGCILAEIMTCRMDDRSEHIDNLRNLFSRVFKDKAREMAIEYLESESL